MIKKKVQRITVLRFLLLFTVTMVQVCIISGTYNPRF